MELPNAALHTDAPAPNTSDVQQIPETPVPETRDGEVTSCKFCKRPSECPTCHTSLDPVQKKDGAVNIDAEIEDTHNQLGGPLDLESLPPTNPGFNHCMPPDQIVKADYSVFLAGSIEMGRAVQWQKHLAALLQHLPISVYNPRRGHWDPSATQEAHNIAFRQQVEWELGALEQATVICFFFDQDTMSPVTMCELGLWASSGKVVVCCNRKFWKGGNVHIVCQRYGVPLVENFGECVGLITGMLWRKGMRVTEGGELTSDDRVEMSGWAPDQQVLFDAGLNEEKNERAGLGHA